VTSPRVSVICIFYNAERFFAEAIESVLAQEGISFELLLVDDGSSDASTAMARDYAERFPEVVRYLQHDGHANLGMSATRNLGLARARGEYVALIDRFDDNETRPVHPLSVVGDLTRNSRTSSRRWPRNRRSWKS
jgi:glycosyltransferase involved in cell wall biosynthesis